MASLQLHVIGTAIFNALAALASAGELDRFSQHTSILRTEAERFRLWAHSLGLHQQGHSSLDYRVRDAAVIKEGLLEVLSDLKDHLEELVAIASGNRLPFTEESVVEMQDDDVESPGSESMPMSESSSESENSFSEVDFRLHSLTDRIDALFTLAVKLKNPKNRPQRTLDQLFKNIPDEQRIGYIQDREAAETMVISYMHRQQLLQSLSEDNLALLGDSKAKRDDVLAHYTQNAQQLIHRIGRSNVRRKQQFTYWKMHAEKIIRPPAKANQLKTGDKLGTAAPSEVARVALSSATSATKYVDSLQKETDDTSMVSYNSRISTAITPQGEKLEWPAPPTVSVVQSYFTCPYCYMICPAKYLSPESWSKHVSYDLQPYQCTYETCTDEKRIYSEREEWIEHEAQHEMVWHCRNHSVSKEFRPEAAYMQHLKAEHSDSQPELLSERHLADAVARSESPRRDCPLCPTLFSDALELQGHLIYHLERFALATLPFLGDDEGVSNMSDNTSQSNQAQNLGRQNSIERDFGQEDTCSWADDGADDDTAMDDSIDKAGSSVLESYIQENVSQQQDIDFQTWISLIEPQNSAITAAGTTIVIAGGGGFAGFLARELSEQYTILVLSRQVSFSCMWNAK
ncbi:hypothetical protein F5B21DRAFT_248363 [Xylaria acuta]|nr:hypothetical protein F5B21DRAFT_248363 [Xylaria acuta]